jgi:hypothetical protein
MLEIQEDVYLIGVHDDSGQKSSIYQLSCSSGHCSWSIINQDLEVARFYAVAIPVPDSFCT